VFVEAILGANTVGSFAFTNKTRKKNKGMETGSTPLHALFQSTRKAMPKDFTEVCPYIPSHLQRSHKVDLLTSHDLNPQLVTKLLNMLGPTPFAIKDFKKKGRTPLEVGSADMKKLVEGLLSPGTSLRASSKRSHVFLFHELALHPSAQPISCSYSSLS
jgi:hypothetical protein